MVLNLKFAFLNQYRMVKNVEVIADILYKAVTTR